MQESGEEGGEFMPHWFFSCKEVIFSTKSEGDRQGAVREQF